MAEPHTRSFLASAPTSRSDVQGICWKVLPAPPVPPECYLQDNNSTRDDEQTAPPERLVPFELALQPSSPSSPFTELASDE